MNWNPTWICPANDLGDPAAVFGTSFVFEKKITLANLTITAMGVYEARLNGRRVGQFVMAPGFMHEKQCICDGEIVVVGTINLDFRSLYLHFENAALFCGYEAVSHVKEDFDALFPICKDMSKEPSERTRRLRLSQLILRLFSPLM